jgi:hypothetical protein
MMTGDAPGEGTAKVVVEYPSRKDGTGRRVIAGASLCLDMRLYAVRAVDHRLKITGEFSKVVPPPGRGSAFGRAKRACKALREQLDSL